MKYLQLVLLAAVVFSCQEKGNENDIVKAKENVEEIHPKTGVWITILGTVQDGGSPHAGCKKECCADLFNHPNKERKVVSLGVIDYNREKKYLFEATPDIATQMKYLQREIHGVYKETLEGVFLTHAHIGHYTGLMYLGKEAMNTDSIPVYAMPRMKTFLEQNGPWSQLVDNGNIVLHPIKNADTISLTEQLTVIPFTVPHRDEFSETVGYKIIGPRKTALFIPDINKWELWEKDIIKEIEKVDFAFLDATFYDASEINNRDISEIPHPFVTESLDKFEHLDKREKRKIYFIHFNHTNPLLNPYGETADFVREKGFNVSEFGEQIAL